MSHICQDCIKFRDQLFWCYGRDLSRCQKCQKVTCRHYLSESTKNCNKCYTFSTQLCKNCFSLESNTRVLICGCGQKYCILHEKKQIDNTFNTRKICCKCKSLRKLTNRYLSDEFQLFPEPLNQLILDYTYNFHHIYRRNPIKEKQIQEQRINEKIIYKFKY